MGKPVKAMREGKAPPKRQREPSPPASSDSEGSQSDGQEDEGGMMVPAVDIALLVQLRAEELRGSFATLQRFGPQYRLLFSQLAQWKETFVLEQLQPKILASLDKQRYFKDAKEDPRCAFYYAAMHNTFRMGHRNFLDQSNLKLTSIGMRNAQIEAHYKGDKKQHVAYTIEDIVPSIRCDDGDEVFTSFLTAVVVSYLVDEAAIKTLPAPQHEAYHAVQYAFHFAPPAAENPNFTNRVLRLRFYTQGGMFYRQATPVHGRIVDVHADPIAWRTEEAKQQFLSGASPFSFFRVLFSGLLPVIVDAEPKTAFTLPPGQLAIRTMLERNLGSIATLPTKDVTASDAFLLERMFEPLEASGIALPPMTERGSLQGDDDNGADPFVVSKKFADYLSVVRGIGAAAASKAASRESEVDAVRHVVLLNASLHYVMSNILQAVATSPLEMAAMMPPGDDEEDEEDDDEEEGEDDEEDEDEEELSAEEGDASDEEPPVGNGKSGSKQSPAPGAPGRNDSSKKPAAKPADCKQQ